MAAGGLIAMDNGSLTATTDRVELYDTNTGVWTEVASMPERRELFGLYQLPNGKIFECGGLDANTADYLGNAELYDTGTETYEPLAPMPQGVFAQFTFYDSVRQILFQQGGNYNGVNGPDPPLLQEYNIPTNTWINGPTSEASHALGYNVQLPDGSIVLVAGRTGPYTATDTVEMLPLGSNTWQFLGRLTSPRWHGPGVLVGDDSILAVGGDNDPGHDQNIFDSTNWVFVRERQTKQGPRMIDARARFVALLSKQPGPNCTHKEVIYVFGGTAKGGGGTLSTCEALDLGTKEDGPAERTFSLPSTSPSLTETECAAVDTFVPIGIIGCGSLTGQLDSAWLTSSNGDNSLAFTISDQRTSPRALSTIDSIELSYASTHLDDTAELHLRYNIGSGVHDTTLLVFGHVASPWLTQPQLLHRESATAYYGSLDTLPMAVDISSAVNLDSLWPYLTDISATFTWDSSVVTYAGYLQATGWTLTSLATYGDSVAIGLQNVGASVSKPLDLGTALFRPKTKALATTWVRLPRFVIEAGGQSIPLCVTDNEDSHWAVKTLGIQSGVTEITSDEQGVRLYPDPVAQELFIQNADAQPASISIYDAIGRVVLTGHAQASSTSTLNFETLTPGIYIAVCRVGSRMMTERISKTE